MLAPAPTPEDGLSNPLKKAITEQVDRVLASPLFNHSKQLPSFLAFVVTHTLAGEVEKIKERSLGVEVFGREAGYEYGFRPIVRVTAELRKRVAQDYQEFAHDEDPRITLAPGLYPAVLQPRGQDPCPRTGSGCGGDSRTHGSPLLRQNRVVVVVTIGSAAPPCCWAQRYFSGRRPIKPLSIFSRVRF